jgi:Amt family ammonium transporter
MPLPALLPLLQDAAPTIVPADTAWMLVSTALVLLMTPALAFFYGGLVRSKNALNTMMMSFVALGAVGIVWALVAYSLAFAEGNAWVGGLANVGLAGVGLEAKGTIPHLLFMAYQGTFAIITAALISGPWWNGCASDPTSRSSCCGRCSCTRRWRTGCGAAAG